MQSIITGLQGGKMKKYILDGYEPKKMFRYFEDISNIPRGSGNEHGIADFLENFAFERKLFCIRDKHNNVFIKKPASKGYEDREVIMLQGHIDMVCECDSNTDHDFLIDGLNLYTENGWLKAKGTSLGADDGVAVAAMMYALDSDELKHPELECLFTAGEETGLYGANGFDYSVIRAKKLINLDSEEEGVATVGCAGGDIIDFKLIPKRVAIPSFCKPLLISVSGLTGGHSGIDIIEEKGNANIILFRILSSLYDKTPFNLVTVSGGNRGNAIPREAEAVIFISDMQKAEEFIDNYKDTVRSWLPQADKSVKIRISRSKKVFDSMLTFSDTSKIINLIQFMPNGVISRIPSKLTSVETSNNLGVIRDNASEGINIIYHGRSFLDSKMDLLELTARNVAKTLGFEVSIYGRYSGWPVNTESKLVPEYIKAAKSILGNEKDPKIEAVHAGVECGIICSKADELEAISFGPEIKDIHSPNERLNLASFERMWKIVKLLIENCE